MKVNWKQLLKIIIAVLTAIAGSIGVVSCMSLTRDAMYTEIFIRVLKGIGLALLSLMLM